MIDYKKDI